MMSVYAMVRMRNGNNAADRELRVIATSKASTTIAGSDHAKILMSRTNASRSRGRESANRSPLKNDSCTRSQRGILGTNTTIAVTTASELTVATTVLRRLRARSYAARRPVTVPTDYGYVCLGNRDDRRVGLVCQPGLFDLSECAVVLECSECNINTRNKWVIKVKDQTEVVRCCACA